MRYIFKILLLGLDGESISFYAHRAFGEEGENKGAYLEWYKEVNAFEDICDLEIDAITDITNANSDFDEMLKTVDGVIYFINPLNREEIEIFDSILHDIRSIKRNVPIVLMYYDQQGILPISINELLEKTWFDYLDIEAFVNLQPREFHQALQCLCLAMITGDTPLNIENAWMRFPIYIQLANIFFKKAIKEEKPELYFFSAQAIKKAAMIADIFNREEYYIISEQAAFLYSKVNLYLEASQILQNVDRKKSDNFKRLYAESMLLEGNNLFNKRKFIQAAKQYLAAAQWSAIEIRDNALMDESFKLAINSYISACRVENAFKILYNLPHEQSLFILREVKAKIIAAADYLIKEENFVSARDQLYRAISVYQQEALFEELELFANKLLIVLINLLKVQINENQRFQAKEYYDEIQNLSETYNVKKPDLDPLLENLITQFLDNLDFGNATNLINRLNSLELKKKLTTLSSKVEDQNKEFIKKKIKENLKKGVDILNGFIEYELDIIKEINTQIIKKANQFIEENDYFKAAEHVKIQVEFLTRIGREEIRIEMIKKALDILLMGKEFDQFFKIYYELSKKAKKVYLRNKFQNIIEKLNLIVDEWDFELVEQVLINFISIFREQLLYDQSRIVSEIFVNSIKTQAMEIVKNSNTTNTIEASLKLINKAKEISEMYLDNRRFNFDEIYEKIIEIYIELENLPSAHAISDMITNKFLKTELNKKIQNLVDEKSAIEAKKAEESSRGEISKEKLSIIKNKAREALKERDRLLKLNKSLRRAYFSKALICLNEKDYSNAIKCYKENVGLLIDKGRLELAGVSLVILLLLNIELEKIEDFRKTLNQIKDELGSLNKSFSEMFSVSLVYYILDIEKLGDSTKLLEALEFMENLPLVNEEISLLYEILGKSLKTLDSKDLEKEIAETEIKLEEQKSEPIDEKLSRKAFAEKKRREIIVSQKLSKLEQKIGDIITDRPEFIKQRKAMKKRYYTALIPLLELKSYKEAGLEYLSLAKSSAGRRDLKTSSLMVLLHGLTLIKSNEPLEKIRSNIRKYLDSLGLNKKLVEETYYILCIDFILDIFDYRMDNYVSKFKHLLEILPLFEEEKYLIEITF